MTKPRPPRLTATDYRAIINALAFVLAGEWDESSHGNVTREQAQRALDKVLDRISHE